MPSRKTKPDPSEALEGATPAKSKKPVNTVSISGDEGAQVLTLRSKTIRTLEGALEAGHVDTKAWEVERWTLNKWDMGSKLVTQSQGSTDETLAALELWQVKVWFKPKEGQQRAAEELLELIRKESPLVPKIKRPRKRKGAPRRAAEIDLMDPHNGLLCFPPGSDHHWSLDDCDRLCMWAIEDLLKKAIPYEPFDKIMFPLGNDFLHTDNIFGTTTKGTPQPEGIAWHEVCLRSELLAFGIVERLKKVAPVEVIVVPGNHDRHSAFMLGRILRAKYDRDKNVTVDASPAPYKFWRYGCNLIGLEHGHSVKAASLPGLMAQERKQDWAETTYREWHRGDQHRQAVNGTMIFDVQGVGIEHLRCLTPANEWHKLNGYNWQQRGATAFIHNYESGREAKINANIDSWTGKPAGAA